MKLPGTLILAAALGACGGTDTSTAPYMWGGAVTVTSGTPGACATVTFSATGVTPNAVSVPVGGCVDFVNADTGSAHWPESNSHCTVPQHQQCPWLNMLAAIPAWSGTGPMPHTQVGTAPSPPMVCGFHDHLHPPSCTSGSMY